MKLTGVTFIQGRNDYGPLDPSGIAIHNTSNDATAEQEASYATRRTDGVGSHFYVDRDSIVQSIATDRRTGHAGSRTGNHNSIAVEITGVNGWSRQQWLNSVAWDRLAEVLTACCRQYNIVPRRASVTEMSANPRVRAFYGHDDMRRAWGGTTHTDPGPNFPWDHLLACVQRAINGETEDDMPFSESQLRALPWQYAGNGMPGVPAGKSTLWALGSTYRNSAETLLKVEALTGVVETLAKTIQSGGGSVDTVAILAGVDQRVTTAVQRIEASTRDAVADLGEGGAAQVRGDQPAGT